MTSRRSRVRRTPTGKRLLLTNRDVEIFRSLARYRYLRSTYLHAFAGGRSETRFKERLGDLFHENFLDRPEAQWRLAECRYAPAIYELGKGGERVLRELGYFEAEPRTCLGSGAHRQFLHSLMICEILASIELETIRIPDLRFIPWPEILAKTPKSMRHGAFPLKMAVGSSDGHFVVPDAVFGLEYKSEGRKTYRFFALEADRATMPIMRTREGQTSYLSKLAAYREVIGRKLHEDRWGVPNLFVLTVASGAQRLAAILGKLTPQTSDPRFLFKAVEPSMLAKPLPRLLQEPWERGGLPPLHIGESR